MGRMRKPPYVHGFVDRHGQPRYYFRREGFKSVALPGLPWSPEFMEAHEAAMAGQSAPRLEVGAKRTKSGSVSAALIGYFNDPSFQGLSASTRQQRRNILEKFRETHGDKRIALLQASHVVKMLANKKPFAARYFLKTLRGFVRYALAAELLPADPTSGVKLGKAKSDGFHSWTEEQIGQFEACHELGTRPRLAQALLLFTAQRRSDVVRMGRQHIRDEVLTVRQVKTGRQLEIPVHPALRQVIDATPGEHLTFLTTESGKSFSPAGFGNLFREWCDQAGLPAECASHGLRKAACRRLAEAGCSEHEIAAISGHESIAEVQRYTKAANQSRMAKSAMKQVSAAFPQAEVRTSIGKPK